MRLEMNYKGEKKTKHEAELTLLHKVREISKEVTEKCLQTSENLFKI